jgi:hypothetical protein
MLFQIFYPFAGVRHRESERKRSGKESQRLFLGFFFTDRKDWRGP